MKRSVMDDDDCDVFDGRDPAGQVAESNKLSRHVVQVRMFLCCDWWCFYSIDVMKRHEHGQRASQRVVRESNIRTISSSAPALNLRVMNRKFQITDEHIPTELSLTFDSIVLVSLTQEKILNFGRMFVCTSRSYHFTLAA
ncbi:hypothetical protein HELRODRAFT_180100 [Helobdella robusta]|uniref:Uncharacterized protein n=1 Tax=Helobdella robusta TaxID=6412 RepID=T1FFH1_HELRO|nr:hypothetical protein HELRODRAFT_180100 [Helobdella robusta]ESN94768.1 hypothetical protein HELRODRAFT_180100 [Helobdella robusta]